MKIAGSYTLPIPQQRAYDAMQDPEILSKCMPGIDEMVKTGDNEYTMKMKMALASISSLFSGKVKIADQNPTSSFRLIVEGSGKVGFMKGDGALKLSTVDGGTLVDYEGEVHVGGTIASVGQRLIDTTAKMMIKRFFDKMAEEAAK